MIGSELNTPAAMWYLVPTGMIRCRSRAIRCACSQPWPRPHGLLTVFNFVKHHFCFPSTLFNWETAYYYCFPSPFSVSNENENELTAILGRFCREERDCHNFFHSSGIQEFSRSWWKGCPAREKARLGPERYVDRTRVLCTYQWHAPPPPTWGMCGGKKGLWSRRRTPGVGLHGAFVHVEEWLLSWYIHEFLRGFCGGQRRFQIIIHKTALSSTESQFLNILMVPRGRDFEKLRFFRM